MTWQEDTERMNSRIAEGTEQTKPSRQRLRAFDRFMYKERQKAARKHAKNVENTKTFMAT